MQEMPSIASSSYGSSTSTYNNLMQMAAGSFSGQSSAASVWDGDVHKAQVMRDVARQQTVTTSIQKQQELKVAEKSKRRLVQVFIADPNESVPLEQSVIYTGAQKLTDSTDQELFFEVDIRSLLEKHNSRRTAMIDKKVKERTEYLEPARVRDLKMVVVTVAEF